MKPSLRERDARVERQVAEFLDRYLYPKVCDSVTRCADRDRQLEGEDVLLEFPGLGELIVDEKAASQYINADLPTFAFEIGFMARDGHVPGWLLGDTKRTDCYLVIWIKARKDWELACEDIEELDCMLIGRDVIRAYLASVQLDDAVLMGIEQHCRVDGTPGQHLKGLYANLHFYLSADFREQPFNVIIYKKLLETLAVRRYKVTAQEVRQLKPWLSQPVERRA